VILTDDHPSYVKPVEARRQARSKDRRAHGAHIVCLGAPRLSRCLKRWGLGVYHGLRRKHIQTYLDEYCFRFNRRHWRRVSLEKILASLSKTRLYAHQITGGRRGCARDKAKRPPAPTPKPPSKPPTPPDLPSAVVA